MKDKRVAVLESRFGEHLAVLLEKQGGIAFRAPALAEEPDLDPEAIRRLIADWQGDPVKLAIFQTGVGTRALFEGVDKLWLGEKMGGLLAGRGGGGGGPKPDPVVRKSRLGIRISA